MRHALIAMAAVLLAVSAPGVAQQVDLPVTRIVLFSSGVGYFEHNGTVEGNAAVKLMFKTGQINDVLKSMVVMDTSGKVTGVNYAASDPLIRALKSFAVDISGDPALADLLTQLRGAEIVVMAPQPVAGKILGVEKQQKKIVAGGTTTILTEAVLNLTTIGGIKSIPLSTVQSLKLKDEKLASELAKALELLIGSRDTQRRAVEVHFAGKGKRKVRVGYVVEVPVWKTSYRLDLSGKKPLIQGWAIVENTSDADWSKVNLSLVSGRPISFVMDLYTPLYLPRPAVVPQRFAGLRPRVYAEGIEAEDKAEKLAAADGKPRRQTRKRAPRVTGVGPKSSFYATGGRLPKSRLELAYGVQAVAAGGKVGELFHFTIESPVDLPRRRSAMLPIINTNIQAEKLSIYNASVLAAHPLNGAWLKNDTGMKMLAGPVTVFDEGAYAGDAQVGNFVPNDKRLLSYAADLNVTVDSSVKSSEAITAVKIVRGVLTITRKRTYRQTYTIKNKANEPRTVIVEHPFNKRLKLLEPTKYEEKTAKLYRFRVPVDKQTTGKFDVVEEQPVSQTIAILTSPVKSFAWYSTSGKVSERVRAALGRAIELKNALSASQSKLKELEKQLARIKSGQDRLRRNISTAGRNSPLGQRYLKKLGREEDLIEQLDVKIESLRKQVAAQQKALADYLKDLNVS